MRSPELPNELMEEETESVELLVLDKLLVDNSDPMSELTNGIGAEINTTAIMWHLKQKFTGRLSTYLTVVVRTWKRRKRNWLQGITPS